MSQPQWIRRIKEQAKKKSVLLVEGNTDVRILGYFLNQVSPRWDAKIVVRSANRKSQVIEGIKYREKPRLSTLTGLGSAWCDVACDTKQASRVTV